MCYISSPIRAHLTRNWRSSFHLRCASMYSTLNALYNLVFACPDLLQSDTLVRRWVLDWLTCNMPYQPGFRERFKEILIRMGSARDWVLTDLLHLVRLHVLLGGSIYDPNAKYVKMFECCYYERLFPGRCFSGVQLKLDDPIYSGCIVNDNLDSGIKQDLRQNQIDQFIAMQDAKYFEAIQLFFNVHLSQEVKVEDVMPDGLLRRRTLTYRQSPPLHFVWSLWFGSDPLARSEARVVYID